VRLVVEALVIEKFVEDPVVVKKVVEVLLVVTVDDARNPPFVVRVLAAER
jgi:hypothetical protein